MAVVLFPRPGTRKISVRQEGDRVLVIQNGQAILDLPYQAALALSKALRVKAKAAEEIDKAPDTIFDQAILMRLGANIGLTSHPVILREAAKEAAWNSDLRRYIPPGRAGGMESQAVFGKARVSGETLA